MTDLGQPRLRGVRGRDPPGAEPLHPREPPDLDGPDDRHLGLDGGEAATAQAAAVRFTKTLRPQDLAQVVQFNDRATTLQAFTNDLAALEAAVRKTEASGPTALHNALYIALKDLMKDKKAAELRRRAIVLLSDGEDTASLVTDEQVLELAKKSEINIYAISLRPTRAQDRQRQAFSEPEYLVNALTRETGGRATSRSLDWGARLRLRWIVVELRTLYSIGYVSANARRDGSGGASSSACPSARARGVGWLAGAAGRSDTGAGCPFRRRLGTFRRLLSQHPARHLASGVARLAPEKMPVPQQRAIVQVEFIGQLLGRHPLDKAAHDQHHRATTVTDPSPNRVGEHIEDRPTLPTAIIRRPTLRDGMRLRGGQQMPLRTRQSFGGAGRPAGSGSTLLHSTIR